MQFKVLFGIVAKSLRAWLDDQAPSRGAALAYYTLFAMAPLLMIVVALAGLWLGSAAAQIEVYVRLRDLLGEPGAAAMLDVLHGVMRPEGGTTATLAGLALVLVGGTTLFVELQSVLDHIWRVPARKQTPVLSHIRKRLISIALILGLSLILVASLALSAMQTSLLPWLGQWTIVARALDVGQGFLLMSTVVALLYKAMPSVSVAWSDVWVGAIVTAALLSVGRWAIGLYLTHGAIASGFGAAGSLVAVLVWMYYSAQIFLLGAEFTWAYATTLGSHRDKSPR
jgi:membrane protein